METTFKLTIEYCGTPYAGWQIQPDQPTVQQTIQEALSRMVTRPVTVIASGRTDAGVHAVAQVAHFKTKTAIPAEKFQDALNRMLPPGITIHACQKVADTFHARFGARRKRYTYRIINRPEAPAVAHDTFWHIRNPLDVAAMKKAAAHLVGTHDFKAFEGAGSPRATTVRTVSEACIHDHGQGLVTLTFCGSGFLKFMVRNLAGTLVDVGLSRTSPEAFKGILDSCKRKNAGPTAPPQGLFLVRVEYEDVPHAPRQFTDSPLYPAGLWLGPC
ncbi:tRNA pseudouridine(38-40) synthase TruA [Desulfoluna sp.]|uniref:tRNA pseudouridine(38-40) synthase TruA n=1 Tax=Desulfoluna sp. TaxID=2045199 RepID=UPI003459710D